MVLVGLMDGWFNSCTRRTIPIIPATRTRDSKLLDSIPKFSKAKKGCLTNRHKVWTK